MRIGLGCTRAQHKVHRVHVDGVCVAAAGLVLSVVVLVHQFVHAAAVAGALGPEGVGGARCMMFVFATFSTLLPVATYDNIRFLMGATTRPSL